MTKLLDIISTAYLIYGETGFYKIRSGSRNFLLEGDQFLIQKTLLKCFGGKLLSIQFQSTPLTLLPRHRWSQVVPYCVHEFYLSTMCMGKVVIEMFSQSAFKPLGKK